MPKIQIDLDSHFNLINKEIEETGRLSQNTFDRFFNKRERNITLETVQAVNSTSYRDELWNPNYNRQVFIRLQETLKNAINYLPKERLGDIKSQVDFILNQTSNSYGNFYDHSPVEQIDRNAFEQLNTMIQNKLGIQTSKTNEIRENLNQNMER